MTDREAPRMAVVPPYAARWLLEQLRQAGIGGAQFRAQAAMLRTIGQPGHASGVELAVSQLRAAAAWHVTQTGCASDDGSGPAETAPAPARLETHAEVPAAQAAETLGVSPRRIGQLIATGVLVGRKVGRAWVVQRASVETLHEARRSRAS